METVDPKPEKLPQPLIVEHPPQDLPGPPPIVLPVFDLPAEDGVPMETPWHRYAMNLLIAVIIWHFRGRKDYYVGGNMFIYYGPKQAKSWSYRGPDFFFVDDVDGTRERRSWIVWEEEGRYPDVIIELTSPSTAEVDRTTKKKIYERTFRTPEYFIYDPDAKKLEGWRLERRYQEIEADERGWLWCESLGLWLGTWEGPNLNLNGVWPRFFDPQGKLILTEAEYWTQRAENERQRADAEAQDAAAAKVQLARLQALLKQHGIAPPNRGTQ